MMGSLAVPIKICQKDQCSSPGTKVPEGHSTRVTDLRTLGKEVFLTSQKPSPPPKLPKLKPMETGLWELLPTPEQPERLGCSWLPWCGACAPQ